jgi:tetratricopeptide (TPR) repeat protein
VRAAFAALLLAAAVLLPHWPRGPADFAYDDDQFVVANQSIRSPREALAALLAPFPPDQPARALYRPLTSLSYALDYQRGGGDPRAFHHSNVLLYGAVVALVYRLAIAYGGSGGFALVLALLFAVHPVHCEAVDAIAGRSELLALLFSLAALLAFLRAQRTAGGRGAAGWLAASWAGFGLACAAKETGAVLPAILAVHAWVLPAGRRAGAERTALHGLGGCLIVLALYLAARLAALDGLTPGEPVLRGVSLADRLHTLGTVFTENLRLLLFPHRLQIDFYYQQAVGIANGASPRSLLGLSLFAAAAASLLWELLRARRTPLPDTGPAASRRPLVACGLAIFLGFWLPVSHLVDFGALMAERFLFAPSLGFLLLAALVGAAALRAACPRPAPRVALAALLVGALALAGAWRSAERAAEWRDPVALWESADRALPDHVAILSNLAGAYLARGEHAAAAAVIERGLLRQPDRLELLGTLADLRVAQGRFDEARAAYQRLLALAPTDYVSWSNLGVLEARQGRYPEAIPHFERALELNPNYADARRNLEATRRALDAGGGGGARPPQ